jgi:hypothetical protein
MYFIAAVTGKRRLLNTHIRAMFSDEVGLGESQNIVAYETISEYLLQKDHHDAF